MRVAIVTENWLPKVDGVTRTLSRLLEHLQTTGHSVLLLGPESGMTSFAGAEIVGTYGIPFLPYPELKLNLWRPGFTERLLAFRPQVIHVVDPVWLGAAALWIIQRYFPKVPVVSSYHTNLATYCHHFGWGLFTPWMWKWNQFCHRQCLYTACPSPSTKQMLEHHGFDHVRLWPRGVDMELFSPSHRSRLLRSQWMDDDSKCVLLYVGRISFEKNIGLLLDAYKHMDHSVCHLVCVGHGPAFDDIQQQYCTAAQKEDVLPITFTGYLQGSDLATAYASADIFVFPSTTETFGQVVLEAMASGLPVVGLQAEGICDLIDHEQSGLLLDMEEKDDVQLISGYQHCMERLVKNPLERACMGQQALLASTEYTWPAAMNCMVQIYKDAAQSSPCYQNEQEIRNSHHLQAPPSLQQAQTQQVNHSSYHSIAIGSTGSASSTRHNSSNGSSNCSMGDVRKDRNRNHHRDNDEDSDSGVEEDYLSK